MIKKTLIAAVMLAASLPAFAASSFYVVVPVPNKKVSNTAIEVALNGYALPSGLIGTPYEGFDFKTLLSVTGDPAYTGYGVHWSMLSGSLPAGLTLNPNGTISGTPTASGTSSFQVRVSYKTKTGDQAYQIVVANITVGLDAGAPPQALVGQSYSYDLKKLLSVTGDKAYTGAGVAWSVVSNSLPKGLYLTNDGVIGGAPTEAGNGSITARVTYKGVHGDQTYQVVSLDIKVALAAATVPQAIVGKAYSYDFKSLLSVTGDTSYNVSSVSFSLDSSTVPPGLTFTPAGVLSGTPTTEVASTPLAVVANYRGQNAATSYALTVAPTNYTVEYLIVAGGGGGGGSTDSLGGGGGGGAGGLINGTKTLTPGDYSVVVGAGGTAVTGCNYGANGANSSAFGVTTLGGGGGAPGCGGSPAPGGKTGGSGGGGGYNMYASVGSGGAGTIGQGYSGGATSLLSSAGGAGGGGAGGLGGTNQANHGGGFGGAGVTSSISGTAVTYAKGGIGGDSSKPLPPNMPNTGNGGAGAYANYVAGFPTAGMSGVVIIRYQGPQRGYGGTVTSAGGYTIHTFSSSGTFTQ